MYLFLFQLIFKQYKCGTHISTSIVLSGTHINVSVFIKTSGTHISVLTVLEHK